jgi:hypothetical protein
LCASNGEWNAGVGDGRAAHYRVEVVA